MNKTDNQQTVFLFSGQGSQYRQMGRVLYEKNRTFRQSMVYLDVIVKKKLGFSVLSELYSKDKSKGDPFEETLITHPAIFMFEVSLAKALIVAGVVPTAVIGVSLGEFAAAVIAGMATQEEMLSAVIMSATTISDKCQNGGMLVVLGAISLYKNYLKEIGLSLAGVYLKNNFVVSGSDEQLFIAQKQMKAINIITARLPVTHAFHNKEMDKCIGKLTGLFSSIKFTKPTMPFYSCNSASVLAYLDASHFIDIACNPIRFPDTIYLYYHKNKNKNSHSTFIDVAPSGSISALIKELLDEHVNVDFRTIFSPYTDQLIDYKDILLKDTFMLPTNKTACLFPGQGAQIKGMGETLFSKYPDYLDQANKILGWSVESVCLNDPDGCLKETLYTQPSLFVVGALAYFDYLETEQKPDFVMGHSLGEYNALLAGGVITFETGVRLVKKRAELMSKAPDGAMAAVIGLSGNKIKLLLERLGFADCYIANKNSPNQTIISGNSNQIKQAKAIFLEAGCKAFIPLQVSGAFHSNLMKDAALEFAQFLQQFDFNEAKIPVISNVTAKPHDTNIALLLEQQITQPVEWSDSVSFLLDQGIDSFVELSEKKVVTNLVNEIKGHWLKNHKLKTPSKKTILNRNKPFLKTKIGNQEFLSAHNVVLPYVCGGMVHGIASTQMVIKCALSGILSFLGTGGLNPQKVEKAILLIQQQLVNDESFGVNLLSGSWEKENVALFLKHKITRVEAAAYIIPSESLVLYRVSGLATNNGEILINHKILAKLSRPEVASLFLAPASDNIVQKLLAEGKITQQQAELSKKIPLADDICVEADSGGHTDQGVTAILLPAILQLRDEAMVVYGYKDLIRIGSGGGIGTPSSAVSAFVLGADFVLTGSINQCTVEAGTSDLVKTMLQDMRVQDTAYAPAGDMFELGSRVQVLRRGVFFPARANRLYDLYTHHESIDEIDEITIKLLEKEYFKKPISDVWKECLAHHSQKDSDRALVSPKVYMAYIFKWYFGLSNRLALEGRKERKVDFQIHTGPALGAFNQWAKGTRIESWQARHVDEIAFKLMQETEKLICGAMKKYQ